MVISDVKLCELCSLMSLCFPDVLVYIHHILNNINMHFIN